MFTFTMMIKNNNINLSVDSIAVVYDDFYRRFTIVLLNTVLISDSAITTKTGN